MLQFPGLKIWDIGIKLSQKKKKNKSLFPQIFRIFYYSEFLVLELKSRRTKFITTLSGKTLSGKVFVRKNYSLGRATKFQKNLPFFPWENFSLL